ncbi:MAG: hypothetical protein RMK98_07420 [Bacteroidia bacterium]|nr:hypothetical protein [Bacteroidia bacterium]
MGNRRSVAASLLLLLPACTPSDMQSSENVPLSGTISRAEVRIKEKWRPLLKITSRKPQKTPSFRITGKEWRVHWKNKEAGEFIIVLYDANNPDYSEVLVNTSSPDEDVLYLTGKGQYVLEVVGKQKYEVIVEELR